jgi:hypothetical protein
MNSLHSAGTQYVFELFEIRPDGADPNQVVNSSLAHFYASDGSDIHQLRNH